MYTASDLRKGLRIEIEGIPYLVAEFNFVKPGKGQGLYTCKLKNLVSGGTVTRTFRAVDHFDEPKIEEMQLTYSYHEGDRYIFMDKDYAQVTVDASALGDSRFLLNEDMNVDIVFHNGRPIGITLPTFVEKKIVQTEPGARGDTMTNVTKPAKVEGGYEIHVPLFINEGDVVRIDTRTGDYADRVAKR